MTSFTAEPPAAIRPRIQRLLLSDEYYEFEELVLVEASFAQVSRRGRGLRQVQIAVTPTKFIIATDELGGEDDDSLFYLAPDEDADSDCDTLEMVSIVPIECVNLSVFSRRRRKLKARFCNGKVYYFELSERGTLGGRTADSVWRQWEERVEFLCPNLNSSSSETSVANTSSTLSTLERRRSLRQMAAAGRKGQVQVSWFARGGQMASGAGSQRADSSVWLTSEEQEGKPGGGDPKAGRKDEPCPPAVPPLAAVSGTTDSSASTCSTCGSSSTSSTETSTGASTTTRTTRTARTTVPAPETAAEAAQHSDPPQKPTTPVSTLERRRSQTQMINRFGSGVEEKCTLSLYLSSDVSLDMSSADRHRLGALTAVANDALHLWELSALSRKRRHTRHSVLAPLAERQLGWTLLAPAGRHLARVRRAASETRLGPVAVRRRVCGRAFDAEFRLPLRRGDICAAASVGDLRGAGAGDGEVVSAVGRPAFWRPDQADRPVTGRAVYARRLELLREFRVAHEKLRAAETRRNKEKQSRVARGLSKLSARAKQSATSQAIRHTYRQLFRSISGVSRPGQRREGEEPAAAGRRTASEGRVTTLGATARQRSVSLSPTQRQRRGDNGDGAAPCASLSGGSLAFCRFIAPRHPGSPEPDLVSLGQRSETASLGSDWGGGSLALSETLSLEASLLDSVSGTTAPQAGGGGGARSDSTAAMPGCTALRRVREIDSTALAHQMTLVDREILGRISATHLASLLTRPDLRLCEPLVTAMLFFHRVVCLVTTNVLLEDTSRDRAKVVTKLVTVAERCYHLRNFHSCKAILSGLQTVPVFRLRQTWEHMKTRHDRKYRAFKSLSKLFADPRIPAYQRVAADVASSGEPFIPFLGDVLSAVLGHNRPPAADKTRRAETGALPGSPVLSWVRRHFEDTPREQAISAARRRVLQRKYVTRWRRVVRCRRLAARRYRPSWLPGGGGGGWPDEVPARRRLRRRLVEDCASIASPSEACERLSAVWPAWRRAAAAYRLQERPLVREYLLLARHYTAETALGLSRDREPAAGSCCTLCSNTGLVTDSSAGSRTG